MARCPEPAPGFQTTHWGEIRAVRTSTPERRQAALNNLAYRYWRPVYCYLRARGLPNADVLDVTQDFFLHVILERDLFGRAEPKLGRFRDFLLCSLRNFLEDHRRRAHAHLRRPEGLVLSLERWMGPDGPKYEPPALDSNPEALFHWKWATALLERVLGNLEQSCRQAELGEHFAIFEERVVHPTLFGEEPTPTEELAFKATLVYADPAGNPAACTPYHQCPPPPAECPNRCTPALTT
jgi:DNA-directed RNA polymerase specialized sigma24 family protein